MPTSMKVCGIAAASVLAWSAGSASAGVAIPTLPSLAPTSSYAVFGSNLNLSNVTINGNVGGANRQASAGIFNYMSASTVNGNIFLDAGVSSSIPSGYSGTVFQPVDQSAARATLYSTSAQLAALMADVTLTNVTSSQTITSLPGLAKIINITGNLNLNSQSLTLSGSANDFFVINVFGGFTLGGSGGIVTTGGATAANVIVNIVGTGAKGTTKVDNIVNGTVLAAQRQLEFHSVSGAVYGGDLEVKLMSGATVDYVPLIPAPGASALAAIAGLIAARRRR